MKPFLSNFSYLLFLCLLIPIVIGCKKESENNFKPVDEGAPSATTDSTPKALPYYLRYRIYREDFNSLYTNHKKFRNNEGC